MVIPICSLFQNGSNRLVAFAFKAGEKHFGQKRSRADLNAHSMVFALFVHFEQQRVEV